MNGVAFGKEIKKLRKKVGIASKELSQQVGKAVTYVSQLERGLIKKPDYKTSYQLLKRLEIEETKIDGLLDYFGIKSPEREQAEGDWAAEQAEFYWLEPEKARLKNKNDRLHQSLKMLIDVDFSAADKLISHIEALTSDKNKFHFLTSLFEYDYSRLTNEERANIIATVKTAIMANYTFDEYGDFVRKETLK
ncbi:helix-turn-helix domain-containing protein [Paenibacillus flagellatus]|nr:helix-turn-helix domain-containing protein [Paenibacillus flagellatus]